MKTFIEPNSNSIIEEFAKNLEKFTHSPAQTLSTLPETLKNDIKNNGASIVIFVDNKEEKDKITSFLPSATIISTPDVIVLGDRSGKIKSEHAETLYNQTCSRSENYKTYKEDNKERIISTKFKQLFKLSGVSTNQHLESLFSNVFLM